MPSVPRSCGSSARRHGHLVLPSASLVPDGRDQSLLFTNAGMVPFKQSFLGREKPAAARIATAQRCMRAGGKHNDLDNVGFTPRHHTFFEMLGNFSFGDYFKEEAIVMAWEFLTRELDLPPRRLRVSVFEEDDESEELWRKVAGSNLAGVVRMGVADNFWSMGEGPGPCGPCSEVYFDVGVGDKDEDRWLEVWNLVFMQYSQTASGELQPLPVPCVDTGMGLERIASVVQGVHSNFDTDAFVPIVETVRALGSGPLAGTDSRQQRAALHVVADHVRAAAFLVADGVVPSNVGRGYVLRRIIRRAAGFGSRLGLGAAGDPFMVRLLPVIESTMGEAYPILAGRRDAVASVLSTEEESFSRALGKGMGLLNKHLAEARAHGRDSLAPGEAANLYTTHGFPIDLVSRLAAEQGFSVDLDAVHRILLRERSLSAAAGTDSTPGATTSTSFQLPEHVLAQWAQSRPPEFTGYSSTAEVSSVRLVHRQPGGRLAWVMIDPCPFYPEGGGQVGDRGRLVVHQDQDVEVSLEVLDTRKLFADGIALLIQVPESQCPGLDLIQEGTEVQALVNSTSRRRAAAHHTATHLLHAALRAELGEQVMQAGSFVSDAMLRFDFSYPGSLSTSQVRFLIASHLSLSLSPFRPQTASLVMPAQLCKPRARKHLCLFAVKEFVQKKPRALVSDGSARLRGTAAFISFLRLKKPFALASLLASAFPTRVPPTHNSSLFVARPLLLLGVLRTALMTTPNSLRESRHASTTKPSKTTTWSRALSRCMTLESMAP